MKRFCLLTLALCLLLCLPACGNSAEKWQEQYELGFRYLAESNYYEAIIAFTAAIDIDPKSVDAYTGLANVYLATGEYEKADAVWAQARAAITDAALLAQIESLAAALPQAREFFESDKANAEKGAVQILTVDFDKEAFRAGQETAFTVIAAYQMPKDGPFRLRLRANTETFDSGTDISTEDRTLPRRGIVRMEASVAPVVWPSGHNFYLNLVLSALSPEGNYMESEGRAADTVYITPEGELTDRSTAVNAYGSTVFTARYTYVPFNELPQVCQTLLADCADRLMAGDPAGVVDIARRESRTNDAWRQAGMKNNCFYTEWNGYKVLMWLPQDHDQEGFQYHMELILRPENGTGYWFDSQCYTTPSTGDQWFDPYEEYTYAVCPCADWQWNGAATVSVTKDSYFNSVDKTSTTRVITAMHDTTSSVTTGTMANSLRRGDFEEDYSYHSEYSYSNSTRRYWGTTTYRKVLTYDETGFLIREGRYDELRTGDGGLYVPSADDIKDHPGEQVADLMGKKHKPPISSSILDELYW